MLIKLSDCALERENDAAHSGITQGNPPTDTLIASGTEARQGRDRAAGSMHDGPAGRSDSDLGDARVRMHSNSN